MYMHRAWGKTRAETWAWKPNMAVGVAAALATGGPTMAPNLDTGLLWLSGPGLLFAPSS